MSFLQKVLHRAEQVAKVLQNPAAQVALSVVPGAAAMNTILGAILAVEHTQCTGAQKRSSVLMALQVTHPEIPQARLERVVDEIVGALNHGSPQEIKGVLEALSAEFGAERA